jgi:predicted transcriptional regulator
MPKVTGVSDAGIQTQDMGLLSPDEFVFMAIPRVQYKMQGWFMGMQQAFIAMAKDKELTGEIRRVLDYMMGVMDFENFVGIEQKQVAEELDMQASNVSRAIKKLLEKGIVTLGPRFGKIKTYKMNWHYAWKGKAINRQKEIAKAYREADPKAGKKSGARAKTGTKKKVQKPAKTKGKLKLVRQKDGEL